MNCSNEISEINNSCGDAIVENKSIRIIVPCKYSDAFSNAVKWKNINFVNKLIKEGKVKLVDQEGNKIKNTKLIWNQ